MYYRGENPPEGAILDYYLRREFQEDEVSLDILDSSGAPIAEVNPTGKVGINRVTWNLRYPDLPVPEGPATSRRRRRAPQGPLVVPGMYTAKLTAGDQSFEQTFEVKEDPRIEVATEERKAWTENLLKIADLYRSTVPGVEMIRPIHTQVQDLMKDLDAGDEELAAEVGELNRMYRELFSRIGRLYGEVSDWVGRLTEDQQSQWTYYEDILNRLESRRKVLIEETLPNFNQKLASEKKIKW
jgi:hypothetical protein